MKKIKIPIGKLFQKFQIIHINNDYFNKNGYAHLSPVKMFIKTPTGKSKINFLVTKKDATIKITLANGNILKVSKNHTIISNGKEMPVNDANSIDVMNEKNEIENIKIIKKEKLNDEEIVYDINIDRPNHYLTPNGEIHHNTKVSTYALLYDICRILHLKNPQASFNLPNTTKIIYMLTNSSLEAAESINFDPMMAIIRESPFFVEHFDKSGRTLFQKGLDIKTVSRKRQLVGRDVIAAVSDEINQEVVKGGSMELVTEMINRINSRFLLKGNTWPCHYYIISSAQTDGSLTEQLKENFEGDLSGVEFVNPARFEVLKHKIDYSGDTFQIFIGTYDADPFIIHTDEDFNKAVEIDPSKIFKVPIEHLQEFKNSVITGIQDVLGKPTINSKSFLKDKSLINKTLSLTKTYDKDYMKISSDVSDRIIDYFDIKKLTQFGLDKKRVLAIDIGLNRDRLGFAILHRVSEKKVDRFRDGKISTYEDFVYWADLVIAFMPDNPGEKIRLEKIRDLIRDLRKIGFKIELIVTDGYQSVDTIQILEQDGFNIKESSVDKNKKPYYAFKYAIEEGRIKLPNNMILKEEISCLIENEKKIDHLEGVKSNVPVLKERDLNVSKDLTDPIANAIYSFNQIKYEKFEDDNFIKELKINSGVSSGDDLYDWVTSRGGYVVDYIKN